MVNVSADIDSTELTALLVAMAKLYDWEMANSPFMQSVTGRHLYFKIANRVIGEKTLLEKSMKDLYQGANLTEKAVRLRLRDFESQNYLRSVCNDQDARVRCLMPTESMYEAMYLHANTAKKILSENFLIFKK
jgi:hypothetical protein